MRQVDQRIRPVVKKVCRFGVALGFASEFLGLLDKLPPR